MDLAAVDTGSAAYQVGQAVGALVVTAVAVYAVLALGRLVLRRRPRHRAPQPPPYHGPFTRENWPPASATPFLAEPPKPAAPWLPQRPGVIDLTDQPAYFAPVYPVEPPRPTGADVLPIQRQG